MNLDSKGKPAEIERPKVSVIVSTYNQEKYIAQALESVLQQVTDFDFEVVVGDDCSRDCTSAIVQRYEKEYPGKVRVNRNERNLGMCMNFACAFLMCRGRYIAVLEGDDYWITPHKLQRQAGFLDAHRECALAFHQAQIVGGSCPGRITPEAAPQMLKVEDLLWDNIIPTCSIMFRRSALTELPTWCARVKVLDWPLCILLMQSGFAGFMAEPMAAYRVHGDGVWSSLSRQRQLESMIEVLEYIDAHFASRYSGTIRQVIAQTYRGLAWCSENDRNLPAAFSASWRGVCASRCMDVKAFRNFCRLLLMRNVPVLYGAARKVVRRSGGSQELALPR